MENNSTQITEENPWMRIVAIDIHGGEMLGFTRVGWNTDKIWDGENQHDWEKFKLPLEEMLIAKTENDLGAITRQDIKDQDHILSSDIYIISGQKSKLQESLKKLLDHLVEEADSVSGDDSYYDYYPGAWDLADGIAKHLDIDTSPYKKLVYEKGLYTDEDSIGHGLPTDEN